MLSYFNNSQNDKFVLASASEIGLYQLDGGGRVEELVLDDSKPQSLSKFQIIKINLKRHSKNFSIDLSKKLKFSSQLTHFYATDKMHHRIDNPQHQ